MTWTKFEDMYSGGELKTGYDRIWIEAPDVKAIDIFENTFGQSPFDVACPCCGSNFAVDEQQHFNPDVGDYVITADGTHYTVEVTA